MQGFRTTPRMRLPRASAWSSRPSTKLARNDRRLKATENDSPATAQSSSNEASQSASVTAPLNGDSDSPTVPIQSRRAALIAGGIAAAALSSSPLPSDAIVSIPDPDSHAPSFAAGDFEYPLRSSGGGGRTRSPKEETVEAFEFVVPLRVVAPRGAVPGDWAADFRSLLGKRGTLAFEARSQVADIVKELSSPEKGWEEESGGGGGEKKKKKGKKSLSRHKSAATADAVCLSDQWLGIAISRGLIQPIPGAEGQRWWRDLPHRWRSLCFRDASSGQRVALDDPNGRIFAAPFRWGCTLVAFRGGRLSGSGSGSGGGGGGEQALADWSDLLQPALRGRVAFSDSPRDLLTAALGLVGLPPSPEPGTDVDARALRGAVLALRRQALAFDGRDLVRALAPGDALAAVGSSSDLLPLALRSGAVSLAAPASGTALWADLWCVPAFAGGGPGGRRAAAASLGGGDEASSGPSPLLPAWFELALTESRAEPGRGLRGNGGASPLLLPPTLEEEMMSEEAREEDERKKRWWQVWRRRSSPTFSSSSSSSSRSLRPPRPPVSRDRAEMSRAALILGGSLPSRQVLSRSDFCVPAADERIERAFREALRP